VFAGLSHALRYCGLLQASVAAANEARRLDPKVRLSSAHTLFMRGDYEAVLEHERGGDNYMRALALVMLGRREDALAEIEENDASLPDLLSFFVNGLASLIRNDFDQSRTWMARLTSLHDPEGQYYVARQAAYIGDGEQALSLLAGCVDGGFFCVPTLAQDPWLDAVRGTAQFTALLRRAETRHRQAVISFLTNDGDRILGIPHPV
jgi:hypothetical protein